MSKSTQQKRHIPPAGGSLRNRRQALTTAIEPLEARQLLSATWTQLAHTPSPNNGGTMELLSNGDVLMSLGESNQWGLLMPSSTGSYVNGTWTRISNMHDSRLYDSTQMLTNGNLFVAGGEYGSGAATAEVYNTLTNTWTTAPSDGNSFIDSDSEILANGNVLIAPVYPATSGYTYLYNPTTNTMTRGAKLYRGSDADEQNWVKLADGSILAPDGEFTSERYIPASNTWVNDAVSPVQIRDNDLGEFGTGALLSDGRVFYVGGEGGTAIYTPSGTSSPGSWVAGPNVPNGYSEDDAPMAVLDDGTVLFFAGPDDTYNGPTAIDIYNPFTNTIAAAPNAPTETGAPYGDRLLDLPDGTVLACFGNTVYDFNPGTTPLAAPTPTISSVAHNSDGSYLLTGTQLNGNSEGAYYGDDAQMNSNYPIVRLTSTGGTVYFARTYNWSSTGLDTGSTPITTDFTLPSGLPAGTYTLNVMVNGFVSANYSLTTPAATDAAPTVATAASASPATATTTTTALSVLGADDGGESNLTYTWSTSSYPSGGDAASFSVNGSNAAKNTTATFQQAGTYTFKVYITDSDGLSTTSSVSVTVNQTLTSIAVTPTPVNLTTGQTKQLTATGYDQFGNSMTAKPTFTWAVTAGTGTVSTAGKYTAPSTGTLATVTATTASFSASSTIGVVDSPWTSADIGSVAIAGYAYDSATTTTITEGSDDIWGTSDDFHYDYQQLTGDGSITAKLVSQTSASTYIKAGLMFRNTLDANSAMAMINDPSAGPLFEWRTAAGSSAAQTATSGSTAPYWLRLVRSGSTFTGYGSSNGTTWTLIGSQTITMNATIYVGLGLSSHNSSDVATAVFSNVSISQPTVATAATASPNPVNGTTTNLSVLGANLPNPNGEASLSYTWAATTVPSGAATPTFSINGTNAAKNTTVTFHAPGIYTFTATILDSVGQSVTSTVTVTVNQALTTITVSPSMVTMATNATQTFTATGYDQFGATLASQPTFTWSKITGVGSINSSTGVYSSLSTAGAATIQAANGLITGTASITVSNSAPTVAVAAAANPSPVTGTTTALSVLGADDGGEFNLSYSWATTSVPAGAPTPTFSINGTNAAKNTTATFFQAGAYAFTVTILDSGGLSVTSSVNFTVNQTLTGVLIDAANATVAAGGSAQASAFDQFGNAFASSVTWLVSGGGSIDSTGLFTAGSTGGTFIISGTSGSSVATTNVTVVPVVYTDASGGDTYAIRISSANTLLEQIFVNTPETSAPTYTIALSQLPSLSFNPTGGDGSLTIDFANGNPLPSGGVSYVGGPNPTAGGNALFIEGAAGGTMNFSIGDTSITDTATPASPILYSALQAIEFDLTGGNNVLTQTAQPVAPLTFNAGPGANTLNVNGGSFTFTTDPKIADGSLTVNDNAAVIFSAGIAGNGINTLHLASLALGPNATAVLDSPADHGDRSLLIARALSVDPSASLDIGQNDVDVVGGNLTALTANIAEGFNATGGGIWLGDGITSSAAASDASHLSTVGILLNNNGSGQVIYGAGGALGMFDGYTPGLNDVLIKYTYYGDANLDGQVDGSDYTQVDAGFNANATGWNNGDFNYDGIVSGSDYTLIDNAFNTQSISFAAIIAPAAPMTSAAEAPVTTSVGKPASASTAIPTTSAPPATAVPADAWWIQKKPMNDGDLLS